MDNDKENEESRYKLGARYVTLSLDGLLFRHPPRHSPLMHYAVLSYDQRDAIHYHGMTHTAKRIYFRIYGRYIS